jgi:hypothetical protein
MLCAAFLVLFTHVEAALLEKGTVAMIYLIRSLIVVELSQNWDATDTSMRSSPAACCPSYWTTSPTPPRF